MDSPEDHGSLDFDPDFAATLVGKYILVGVTVEDPSDTPRAARDTSSSRPGWSRSAPAGRTRSTGPSALRWCAPRSGSRTPGIGVNCPWLPAVASRTPVPECLVHALAVKCSYGKEHQGGGGVLSNPRQASFSAARLMPSASCSACPQANRTLHTGGCASM